MMLQARNASEEYAVKLFTAVYDGVKPSLNVGLQTVILDPASQHLASKLLDLAYDLGLQVCEVLVPKVSHLHFCQSVTEIY